MALTAEQVVAAMAPNSGWPYAGAEDGWVKAHDALRADMCDLSAALRLLASAGSYNAWQVGQLKSFWAGFLHHTHFHHANEEKFVMPFMAKKTTPPEKISSDHKALLGQLEELDTGFKALQADAYSKAALELLASKFEAMEKEMRAHFEEEEAVGLPMLRHHFTLKEWKPTEEALVRSGGPAEFGWVARPMGEAKAKQWLTHTLKVPGFVQKIVLMPELHKYERNVTKPFQALLAGASSYVPEPAPGCACSVM